MGQNPSGKDSEKARDDLGSHNGFFYFIFCKAFRDKKSCDAEHFFFSDRTFEMIEYLDVYCDS